MSAKYTFLAWDTPVKEASTKLTLLQLANNADDNGFSYYSISKMAKSCDMSDRTFMRKIQNLEKLGVLTVERRANRPSLYTLVGDEMGVTICHLQESGVTGCHAGVTGCHAQGDNLSHDPNITPNTPPVIKDILCEISFQLFYSAGLPKSEPNVCRVKFLSLAKKMKAEQSELGELLRTDIQYRLKTKQFGFDKLHPKRYLTNERWLDEYGGNESNNGQTQGDRKKSAAERTREYNERTYGSEQPSGGLGLATNGGNIRGELD